jgi:hypothetical protein
VRRRKRSPGKWLSQTIDDRALDGQAIIHGRSAWRSVADVLVSSGLSRVGGRVPSIGARVVSVAVTFARR